MAVVDIVKSEVVVIGIGCCIGKMFSEIRKVAVIGSVCCRYSKIRNGCYREVTVAEVKYIVKSEKRLL